MAKPGPTRRYVALLRGINVGGNKLIKMNALSKVFSSVGLKNVRTFIASGNVVFDSSQTDASTLARKIERKLFSTFGHEIVVVVLRLEALAAMAKGNPFKKFAGKKDVMLCAVFFVAEPPRRKLGSSVCGHPRSAASQMAGGCAEGQAGHP